MLFKKTKNNFFISTKFFDDPRIKILKDSHNGSEQLVFFLHISLLAGNNNGKIFFTEELIKENNYTESFVKEAMTKYIDLGLIKKDDYNDYFIADIIY